MAIDGCTTNSSHPTLEEDGRFATGSLASPRQRVLVALEYRFGSGPGGRVLSDSHYVYAFWQRYLSAFQEVVILARVAKACPLPDSWIPVEGPGVRVVPLPDYQGPWQYLKARHRILRAVQAAVKQVDCGVLRVPGQVGNLAEPLLRSHGRPIGLEVVGNPYDSLAPGSVDAFGAMLFRHLAVRRLRKQCTSAQAVSYVTAETLQKAYPPHPAAYTTHYSSISLPEQAYATSPRQFEVGSANTPDLAAPRKLIFIGSLAQYYKGLDTLMRAMTICIQRGATLQLEVLGDGSLRGHFEALARDLRLNDRIAFMGQLPAGPPVWERLRAADLFVIPSYAEGLPRVLIEAMAAGLPCIGTHVGGIPELIPSEDRVPPKDPERLASLLMEVLGDPRRMSEMASRNLRVASDYQASILQSRREAFYRHLSELIRTPDHRLDD